MSATEDTLAETIRMRIGGEWKDAADAVEARDPHRNVAVARMPLSSDEHCEEALRAADSAREAMSAMPARERAAYLRRVADLVVERAEDIAVSMTRETGKALSDSRLEVMRSADTLRLCGEEAVRIEAEHVPMEASALGAGKIGMLMRFPVGIVSAITPFNAPVNLMMHKIGPSVAAGNATILKCSPKAPLCVHKTVECFIDAGGLPDGGLNTLYGDGAGPKMVSDPRVGCVSFTGSTAVGKIIRASSGMKRIVLELGGVGPTIVHADADIEAAAIACARKAFMLAGQSCVSVQNIFVHHHVYESFMGRLLEETGKIRVGDPMDPNTEIGTLIDEAAAIRVHDMVGRSLEAGAEVLAGGQRAGAQLQPTVLHKVDPRMEIVCTEIFGPVVSVLPYTDVEAVMQEISASPYGLQAGIFTSSIALALAAIKAIRTGGVIINGTSRWRSDQMPYGGVKESGTGREGPKYAIRDMTEERFFVLN